MNRTTIGVSFMFCWPHFCPLISGLHTESEDDVKENRLGFKYTSVWEHCGGREKEEPTDVNKLLCRLGHTTNLSALL